MDEWSADEAARLRSLVSRYGRSWAVMARSGELPGRSSLAMRHYWGRMKSMSQASSHVHSPAALSLGATLQLEQLPAPSIPAPARNVHAGRSWDYVVGKSIVSGVTSDRVLSVKQARLVRNWQLDNACGHGLLLCNLKRAEDTLRRHFLSSVVCLLPTFRRGYSTVPSL